MLYDILWRQRKKIDVSGLWGVVLALALNKSLVAIPLALLVTSVMLEYWTVEENKENE